jgi:hypothetical protein
MIFRKALQLFKEAADKGNVEGMVLWTDVRIWPWRENRLPEGP